jgi:hypothetical protein
VAYYDLTNGTAVVGADIVAGATNLSASIASVGNGWFRVGFTFTTTATSGGMTPYIGPCTTVSVSGDNRSAVGVVGQGIYVWGLQVEQGAFPTSYIATTAAAVTRAIDVCWMPTAAWYNPSAFSLSVECYGPNAQGALAGFSDLTFGNSLYFSTDATPTAVAAYPFGAGPAGILMGPRAAVNKFCCSVTTTRIAFSCNGATPTAVVIATAPFAPTSLALGNDPWSRSTAMDGWLRRARVWSRALSDSELQSVTT